MIDQSSATVVACLVGAGIVLASTWLANFIYAFRTPVQAMTKAGANDAHRMGTLVGLILAVLAVLAIMTPYIT